MNTHFIILISININSEGTKGDNWKYTLKHVFGTTALYLLENKVKKYQEML